MESRQGKLELEQAVVQEHLKKGYQGCFVNRMLDMVDKMVVAETDWKSLQMDSY